MAVQLNKKGPRTRSYEAGAALVMSLVILMILTIMGVAALSTSSLEERMAGNVQESTRVFEAAESGLNRASNTAGTFVLTSQTTLPTFTIADAQVAVTVTPTELSPPKRGLGYSASCFDAANFEQLSTATAGTARSVQRRGVAQIVPKC